VARLSFSPNARSALLTFGFGSFQKFVVTLSLSPEFSAGFFK